MTNQIRELMNLQPLKEIRAFLCNNILRAGDLLLSILPLTFLPVSARLLDLWDELRDILVPLLAISVVSTVVVMAVTGYTIQRIARRKSGRGRIQ